MVMNRDWACLGERRGCNKGGMKGGKVVRCKQLCLPWISCFACC